MENETVLITASAATKIYDATLLALFIAKSFPQV
jgi:hypothetical protein